jgi:hypothetical protein
MKIGNNIRGDFRPCCEIWTCVDGSSLFVRIELSDRIENEAISEIFKDIFYAVTF